VFLSKASTTLVQRRRILPPYQYLNPSVIPLFEMSETSISPLRIGLCPMRIIEWLASELTTLEQRHYKYNDSLWDRARCGVLDFHSGDIDNGYVSFIPQPKDLLYHTLPNIRSWIPGEDFRLPKGVVAPAADPIAEGERFLQLIFIHLQASSVLVSPIESWQFERQVAFLCFPCISFCLMLCQPWSPISGTT
jgi:hypothetical protein